MNVQRPPVPRRTADLSFDEVAAEARALGLDVERVPEAGLRASVSREKGRRWAEENREAIEANNAEIELNGLWCDDYRLC